MASTTSGHSPQSLVHAVERAGLGVAGFDAGLRVRSASPTVYRILERRPGSLVGRTAMEAFLDHRAEALLLAAARGGAGSLTVEPSDRRTYRLHAQPAGGGAVWVVLEDVTELERLRRIRSELIDNLSHELRTPLTSMRLLTEMLLGDLESLEVPERVRERVATIDIETGHLVQMINELLDLARMEQATVELRRDELTLEPMVQAAFDRLRTFAERQGVSLVAEVGAELPPILGDEEQLGRLLLNLLHNAIKFSAEGGTVTVTAAAGLADLVVAVRDEGVGIPVADQPRVFERFYKVDRARRRGHGGTGLGLAIARHIVEAHDGRIWLVSQEGRGSVFSFSLPRA